MMSLAPFEELGSRAQAMCGGEPNYIYPVCPNLPQKLWLFPPSEVTFHNPKDGGCARGSCFRNQTCSPTVAEQPVWELHVLQQDNNWELWSWMLASFQCMTSASLSAAKWWKRLGTNSSFGGFLYNVFHLYSANNTWQRLREFNAYWTESGVWLLCSLAMEWIDIISFFFWRQQLWTTSDDDFLKAAS